MKKQISLAPSTTGYLVDMEVQDPVITSVVTELPDDGGGDPSDPPVANAGADRTLTLPANSTTLDGSLSTHGLPVKRWSWIQITKLPYTITNSNRAIATVRNLVKGVYVFELRVADMEERFSLDRVTITVNDVVDPPPPPPPINKPPTAVAGNDQSILLPLNAINLDGSLSNDPDGQITGYSWKQVTDFPCILAGANTAVLKVSGLVAAVYIFRLTITDSNDSTDSDDVTITVKKEVIEPPPNANTYPFTLTQNKTISRLRHFAGFENWNGQNYASFTGGWKDYYFRFAITDVIKGANATVDWTRLDNEFKKAINQGAGMSIGFMPTCDSDGFLATENYGGASSRYPLAWHNQMQSENVRDFSAGGNWIPNWNSTSFLNNWAAFLKRVNEHIETTSYNGVRYKDIMNYVEIRGYAQWGEFHWGGLFDNVSQLPAGTRPSVNSYKRIIDMHCDAFPNYPLVIIFAAYDANWLPHTMTPPEVTLYALTKKNGWGLIGWRRDQWANGSVTGDNYVHDYLERNSRSFGSSGAFSQIIMERWKYAPVVGEPYGPGANLSDLKRQLQFYHATSVGNGNYPNTSNAQGLFKDAVEMAGAKLSLNKGQLKVSTEFDFDITLTAENFGNSCVYNDRLNLVYELRNSGGQVMWTSNSNWKPLLKVPGTYAISDHYKVTTVPAGTYSLVATIKDNYRALPLFNNNQNSDGTIVLATGIKY